MLHEIIKKVVKEVAVKESYCTCDKCGIVIPDVGADEIRDFELSYKTGSVYPGYISGEKSEISDLCDDCVALLFRILEGNGFKISNKDVD